MEHQIGGPHVYAQLQGGRADQSLQALRFEVLLHLDADILGEGAVVYSRRNTLPELVPGGDELRSVPGVDEEEGAAMCLEQVASPPERRRLWLLHPQLLRQILVRLSDTWQLHLKLHGLDGPQVHDVHVTVDPAQEVGDLLWTSHGG